METRQRLDAPIYRAALEDFMQLSFLLRIKRENRRRFSLFAPTPTPKNLWFSGLSSLRPRLALTITKALRAAFHAWTLGSLR